MTKTGRDKRKRLRAERREAKCKRKIVQDPIDLLAAALLNPVAIDFSSLTPDTVMQIADIATLNPSEVAFNQKMEALGVPSFGEWFAKKGQAVIDKAAMDGKVGAFVLQQMLNPPKDVTSEEE